ncbi:MAG TPA: Fur family transcriptional regulator [Candidatus Limnocylindrales bacterium]
MKNHAGASLDTTRDRLRSRGMRWTPQRKAILEVLASTEGHVTGAELIERCRERDPDTTPSTVYRTLDVLEDLGLVRHSHGHDGREEFHVLPGEEHGHLTCESCGATAEIDSGDARRLLGEIERNTGYRVDVSHLAVSGLCRGCSQDAAGV